MANKFFYNRVYNTKRTIINIIIIGVCIIGVIICFIITRNLQVEDQNNPGGELSLKQETTVEVNEKFTNEIFFSKIENVSLDEIKVNYPSDYDISKIGRYKITLEISGKTYEAYLNVVDTMRPELFVQPVTIAKGKNYTANDFVKECTDNSNHECQISFFTEGVNEEGELTDYSQYQEIGVYPIKIVAKDDAGNENVQETTLTIEESGSATNPETPDTPDEPATCKYGNNKYDTEKYLVAVDITTNGCAVSLDLYKSPNMMAGINKLMETETTKIKKDLETLKLTGDFSINRKIVVVLNEDGDGIVGYELQMTVTITKNDGSIETITEYKVNNNGERVFISNNYNLSI